jgi:hypothetical protein
MIWQPLELEMFSSAGYLPDRKSGICASAKLACLSRVPRGIQSLRQTLTPIRRDRLRRLQPRSQPRLEHNAESAIHF